MVIPAIRQHGRAKFWGSGSVIDVVTIPAWCHQNPYLVSKLLEVLYVINPTILDSAEALHARFMSHPISEEYLPSALMKFYTGKPKHVLTFTTMTVNYVIATTQALSFSFFSYLLHYSVCVCSTVLLEFPNHPQEFPNLPTPMLIGKNSWLALTFFQANC